ncbi:hypothetical protein CEUSTIGMA_g709.t1 [Chlamydomonas eustigma]|uniref:Uncharacterized protein n=1 Tax=Chlamydomonas eustigma TaxID=1157962 RepID=A0A250WQY4_9CHLO|nr:hypothetical protein CEUSTIGMA_g709.t1 [Chlamydomonas eustigma]|eukprot:GAX73255.1 hypothetical protein CEUSTIGMA_g709.t1 [Chlamydomonas eustigma]
MPIAKSILLSLFAGLIVQLLSSELSSAARDPLSALSALNMVSVGLSHQSVSAGLSSQLFSVLAASFPVLLEDSVLRPGALRAGALFLKGVLEEEWGVAPMCVDGSSDSSSSGLPLSASLPITFLADKQAFTHGLRHILDDTGSESVEDEVSALDAVCDLAETRSGSELLLGDHALLSAVIERALGRPKTSSQEVRVASLHALASLAGLPRAHQWQERSAALLSEGAESILRSEVYQAAAAGNSQRSPAEIIHTYLKQPFHDLKGATYHAASALAVRHWFAAELCRNAELMERLLSPCGSESGQLACSWRFSLLTSLWTTVQASFKLEASSPDSVHRPTLLNVYKELQFAVQGGPYGLQLDNRSSKEDPIPLVATQQS